MSLKYRGDTFIFSDRYSTVGIPPLSAVLLLDSSFAESCQAFAEIFFGRHYPITSNA